MGQRAIVLSDLHGQLTLLENALDHAGFDATKDRLIVAGDTCDIGSRTMEIHEVLFGIGAEQLVGNHEISHLCRIGIRPYDDALDPDYIAFIGLGIDMGEFSMAAEHDGVFISHAGLSKRLVLKGFTERSNEDTTFRMLHENGELTAEKAAEVLNERLKSRVHVRIIEGDDGPHPILDVDGDVMWTDWFYPFWFRAYHDPDWGAVQDCGFYDGFKQVVGHTPVGSFSQKQQRLIHGSGVRLTDPYARAAYADPRSFSKHYRYAVIEDGEVIVHDSKKG